MKVIYVVATVAV